MLAKLDAATVLLVVAGVLCGKVGVPPVGYQSVQVALIMGSLTIIVQILRDRRRTRRGATLRWFNPNPKLLAVSGIAVPLAAALGSYTASSTGYDRIGFGFFLSGCGWAVQFLITCRKP